MLLSEPTTDVHNYFIVTFLALYAALFISLLYQTTNNIDVHKFLRIHKPLTLRTEVAGLAGASLSVLTTGLGFHLLSLLPFLLLSKAVGVSFSQKYRYLFKPLFYTVLVLLIINNSIVIIYNLFNVAVIYTNLASIVAWICFYYTSSWVYEDIRSENRPTYRNRNTRSSN